MSKHIICSARYCPNWGAWEVYRELFSNSKDADPDGCIVNPNGEYADFYTKTAPKFVELAIIGEGTKVPNTDTIGQFGEGLKLAALAAIRAGGNMIVTTKDYTARYLTEAHPESENDVLVIERMPGKPKATGCTIRVFYPDVDFNAFAEKMVPRESFMRPTKVAGHVTLYCKGIEICTLPERAMFDYNINGLTINRDRSTPNVYTAMLGLMTTLESVSDSDRRTFCYDMLYLVGKDEDNASFEDNASYHYMGTKMLTAMTEQFKDLYGEKAVIASTEATHNEYATMSGYTPVTLPKGLKKRLSNTIITAESLFSENGNYRKVLFKDDHVRAAYEKVKPMFNLPPSPNIQWFEGDGKLKIEGDTLWINVKLGDKAGKGVAAIIGLLHCQHPMGTLANAMEMFDVVATLIEAMD